MTFQLKDLNHPIIQKFLKIVELIQHIPPDGLDETIETLEQIIDFYSKNRVILENLDNNAK